MRIFMIWIGGYPQRETPIVSAVELSGARTMAGESALIFSELSAEQIKAYGLNMSHRISVAITAVDADGWRSQPIEALVGIHWMFRQRERLQPGQIVIPLFPG